MSQPIVMPRCCPAHRDWATLAEHLLDCFTEVPASAILRELRLARQAGDLFGLALPDALDCAELVVRQRVFSATGGMASSSGAELPAAFVRVAQSSPLAAAAHREVLPTHAARVGAVLERP